MYDYESELVEAFTTILDNSNNDFLIQDYAQEFDYRNGRADIIGKTKENEVILFEAKLSKWKDAMHQAYRGSSFSHFSYVLIPKSIVQNALKHTEEFTRRGIGLCSIEQGNVIIEIPATRKNPLQPWLTSGAIKFLEVDKDGTTN